MEPNVCDCRAFALPLQQKAQMSIIPIASTDLPELDCYARLTDHQLRSGGASRRARIIVESPKVILTALAAGLRPCSLLCERRHITGDASPIVAQMGGAPVYTGERDVLARLTGYTLTRGVLCCMERPQVPTAERVCRHARRVAVLDAVCDTTNIGAIFRSAAALGVDGVLLTRDSCDPFNRRSIRVSMGTVFQVPWAWVDDPVADLHALGFKTLAMALRHDSVDLRDDTLKREPRLAILMGTEGDGLPARAISRADYVARIPMAHHVDSLNVAAASAIAFWELCVNKT